MNKLEEMLNNMTDEQKEKYKNMLDGYNKMSESEKFLALFFAAFMGKELDEYINTINEGVDK